MVEVIESPASFTMQALTSCYLITDMLIDPIAGSMIPGALSVKFQYCRSMISSYPIAKFISDSGTSFDSLDFFRRILDPIIGSVMKVMIADI